MIEPKRVILFSGGRTSGYMLRLLHAQGKDSDALVIFCNTGKEREETLLFVHRFETALMIPVIWLEYHRVPAKTIPDGVFPTARRNQNLKRAADAGQMTHWFRRVSFETASRNGQPFDEMLEWASVLPNPVNRICSTQLKIRTAMRFLFSLGIKEYAPIIGIRKDEEHRATEILASCDTFEHPEFPLIQLGIKESDVMDAWKNYAFDLRLKSYEGNCDLCFLKAKWKRLLLIKENPGMADWWKSWEARKRTSTVNGRVFRSGESYSDLEHLAVHMDDQRELCFIQTKDIPCSCAEKGFGSDDD